MQKLTFFIILGLSLAASLPRRPRFVFHGLGDDCRAISDSLDNDSPKSGKSAAYVEDPEADEICVETGAGVCGSTTELRKQAKIACTKLNNLVFEKDGKVKPQFQFGFHFVGHSQGGLIARLVFHNCEKIRPLVATIISNGTPNVGMSKLPDFTKLGMEEGSVAAHVMNALARTGEAWAKMYRRNHSHSFFQYLNLKSRRAVLIDELLDDKNVNYGDLELFINLSYGMDEMVVPRTSPTFGLDINEETQVWDQFPKSEFANRLGLKAMWDERRMWNCRADTEHMNLEGGEIEDFSVFHGDWCQYEGPEGDVQAIRQQYRACSVRKMAEYRWNLIHCDQTQRIQLERQGQVKTGTGVNGGAVEGSIPERKNFVV